MTEPATIPANGDIKDVIGVKGTTYFVISVKVGSLWLIDYLSKSKIKEFALPGGEGRYVDSEWEGTMIAGSQKDYFWRTYDRTKSGYSSVLITKFEFTDKIKGVAFIQGRLRLAVLM